MKDPKQPNPNPKPDPKQPKPDPKQDPKPDPDPKPDLKPVPLDGPAMRLTGKHTIVSKAGTPALRASYRARVRGPDGSDLSCRLAPAGFFPAEQVRFSCKVWFDDSFPWGAEMRKVGGKILGLRIGDAKASASGGNYSPDAASYRLTWSRDGAVSPYLYPQVARRFSKGSGGDNIGWDLLDQPEAVRRVGHIASGLHLRLPGLAVRKGRWNDVELFCKLNTPGKRDGVLELCVNGERRRLDGVRYRNDSAQIQCVFIQTFFGGSTLEYAPPHDTKAWYADFAFSKQ